MKSEEEAEIDSDGTKHLQTDYWILLVYIQKEVL